MKRRSILRLFIYFKQNRKKIVVIKKFSWFRALFIGKKVSSNKYDCVTTNRIVGNWKKPSVDAQVSCQVICLRFNSIRQILYERCESLTKLFVDFPSCHLTFWVHNLIRIDILKFLVRKSNTFCQLTSFSVQLGLCWDFEEQEVIFGWIWVC